MKHIFSFALALLLMVAATSCQNGQGGNDASSSAQSDSLVQGPHPDLLIVYFYDGGDGQSMGENIISAFDDLKERFNDRIALWAIDSSINTDLYGLLDVQDLPAAIFITDTQVPFSELKAATSLSGNIDREALTQTAIQYLDS